MRLMTRMIITTVLAVVAIAGATALFAAGKYTILCFEAENGQGGSGKVWAPKKYVQDPKGNAASGKKVLAVPHYPAGEKPVRDEVTYKVKIDQPGAYYLWANTLWRNGCGNSFYVKVEGYKSGDWIIGGDGTYDVLHWVCLTDGGKNGGNPRPLMLKKGTVTITIGAKESATAVDQFVLTTDKKYLPVNTVKPTPNILVK
jgi:hypothetical protein